MFSLLTLNTIHTNPEINKIRVDIRESMGGHSVPEEKIKSRYYKALDLIPELVELCDIVHIYDNNKTPNPSLPNIHQPKKKKNKDR